MVTMLLGGLWHGANWTFVIWGGIHGVWLSLERLFRGGEREQSEAERSAAAWLKRIAIFHLVCLTWVFFRAQSLAAAVDYLRAFAVLRWEPQLAPAILFLCGFTIPMFLLDLSMEARREEYYFQFSPDRLRMAVGVAAIALVVLFAGNLSNAFIYFQF
jgi:D-alanyl-lipoteichoic acid acyltransferase DltB (MBOAT superfamily)